MPKLAFLGAGSVVFTRQLLTDLLRFDDLPTIDLALHDIDAARLDVALAMRSFASWNRVSRSATGISESVPLTFTPPCVRTMSP